MSAGAEPEEFSLCPGTQRRPTGGCRLLSCADLCWGHSGRPVPRLVRAEEGIGWEEPRGTWSASVPPTRGPGCGGGAEQENLQPFLALCPLFSPPPQRRQPQLVPGQQGWPGACGSRAGAKRPMRQPPHHALHPTGLRSKPGLVHGRCPQGALVRQELDPTSC